MSFPSKFGKYLLLERVNVGGMAEVFKAKGFGAAGFERIQAVKRILPNLLEDDEFVRMFIDEARIAVQLNHPNIVQIYELGKHGEHYYIAMEYVPSRDLRGILDRLRANDQLMPIPQAAFITARVAEGLDYAHRRKDAQGAPMNIIHRDVSPQNILIGFEGEVKVIDFGIAKAANRASKTQNGVLKGKFGYMSPEQVRGLQIDRRSDIFAVGVLLYEMLTGERLFIGESDFSTLERVRNADVLPPSQFNKKISPQLENIVLKTLARDVEDRYQWASELAQDLVPFVNDAAGPYSARRLAASMKETYSAEVAAERAKLEEFLRINPDDIKERGAPLTSSVLPLPQRAGQQPSPVAAPARNRPPPGPAAAGFDDEPEDNEDKTFVIESNTAGAGQQPPGAEFGKAAAIGTRPSQPMTRTDDVDASEEASLYGDDRSSVEDDVRTMISADAGRAAGRNIAAAAPRPEPAPPRSKGSRPAEAAPPPPFPGAVAAPPAGPAASSPSPAPAPALAKAAVAAPRGGRSFDAVAAALAEEDPGALSSIGAGGPSPAAPAWAGASSGLPFGFIPPSNVAFPPIGAAAAAPMPPAPMPPAPMPPAPMPARTGPAGFVGDASPFAPTSTTPPAGIDALAPPAARFGGPPAMPPIRWVPVAAAAVLSAVALVSSAAFVAVRALGPASDGELELHAVAGVPLPADLQVLVDDVVVARSLPARVALPDGTHMLQVVGGGMVPVRRPVVGTGGLVRQAIAIVATAPGADAAAPATGTATQAAQVAVAAPGPATGVAVAGVPPPVVGGWRLSLAAVDDAGDAVDGAAVHVNGVAYGQTPFEAELDPSLASVEVKIAKDGFSPTTVTVQRNARPAVGPATVSLRSLGAPPAIQVPTPTTAPATPSRDVGRVVEGGAGTVVTADTPSRRPPEPAATKEPRAEPRPPRSEPVRSDPPSRPEQQKQEPARDQRQPATREVADIELGTSPSAETTIDGRKYGSTPFFGPKKLTLPVGTHRVEFLDKASNKKHRYQLKLKKADPSNKVIIQFNRNDGPLVKGEVEMRKLD